MGRFLGISRKVKYDGSSPAGSNLAPLPRPLPAGGSSQLSAITQPTRLAPPQLLLCGSWVLLSGGPSTSSGSEAPSGAGHPGMLQPGVGWIRQRGQESMQHPGVRLS